jgi:hypothetical protein
MSKSAPLKRTKAAKTTSTPVAAATKAPPLTDTPLPAPVRWVRGLILFFAATLPLYFDLSVPEVSGDIRWMATSFFAGLCALILLGQQLGRGPARLPFKLQGPFILWVAAGLAFWALLSLTDALNAMRGIILIKALYAQLILLVCVWWVVAPRAGDNQTGRTRRRSQHLPRREFSPL